MEEKVKETMCTITMKLFVTLENNYSLNFGTAGYLADKGSTGNNITVLKKM